MKANKKIRRLLAFCLATMLALPLVACGNAPANEEEGMPSGDIVIMSWDSTDGPGMNKLIEKFNETYPDIHVTFESVPWTDYFTKLTAGAQGGEMPDIFVMHPARFDKFMYGDILLPLDDILAEDPDFSWDNYPTELANIYVRDGQHYGLPNEFNINTIFYNTELFDQAGVPYPDGTWTWDEFVDVAKQLTDVENGIYGFGARNHSTEGYEAFIYSNGGCVLTDDKKSGFDLPETIDAIQKWKDLIYVDQVSPTPAQFAETDLVQQFVSGKVAMALFDSWRAAVFAQDSNIAGKFNVTNLPVMDIDTTYINSNAWVIPKDAPNVEAAAVFLRWLSTKEAADLYSQTVRASARIGSTELFYDVAGEGVDLEMAYNHAMETGTTIPATRNKDDWSAYQETIMGQILSDEISVEEGCLDIANYMNQVIANE